MDSMTDERLVKAKAMKFKVMSLALLALAVWLGFKARNEARMYDYIGVPLERNTITVSGEGKVVGIPDIANIDLGTTVERATVGAAQAENTKTMNALIDEIKKLGVDQKDIQTTSYNVFPQYDYNDGKQRLRGYSVSQNVHVKIRDLEKVGDIVGKAGSLGANQIGGISFSVDDPEALKAEARVKALENAKDKAEALAEIAGVKLRRVVSFSESFGGTPQPYYYARDAAAGAEAQSAAPTLEAGSSEINATVNITYEIQ
jgi:uncharacterized protein YggE